MTSVEIPTKSLHVENFAGNLALFGPFFSTKSLRVENFAGILRAQNTASDTAIALPFAVFSAVFGPKYGI